MFFALLDVYLALLSPLLSHLSYHGDLFQLLPYMELSSDHLLKYHQRHFHSLAINWHADILDLKNDYTAVSIHDHLNTVDLSLRGI